MMQPREYHPVSEGKRYLSLIQARILGSKHESVQTVLLTQIKILLTWGECVVVLYCIFFCFRLVFSRMEDLLADI